jgi:hypothetical protein
VTNTWWQKLAQKLRSIISGSISEETSQRKQQAVMNVQMVFDLTREPRPNLGLPPNAIPGLSVIKELVRGLRYRSVDQLVGIKLELTSIEMAPDEVCALIRQHGIEVAGLRDLSTGAFLKYGLLDYDFLEVVTDFVPEPQRVRFLKDMGFLPDKKDVDDGVFHDAGIGFLEEMVDEVRENKLLFKILLDSQGAYRGAKGVPREKWMNVDPNKYFPCEFIVRDACLTNCSLIWLNKHFYL